MRYRIIIAVILLYFFCALPVHGRDYSGKTFYFIVIDRFNDGDSSNNKEDRLFSRDRSDWRLYWGGDFKGITKHVGYLKALGITGLWITPVVKNTDYLYDYGSFALSAYHGYWACDFREINDRFGTREELKELLTACRKEGIFVILDIVVNHTSPIGKGTDGALFDRGRLVTSYSKDHEGIFHHNKGIDHRKPYDPLIWDACNLFDLADLNQDNDFVNKYLRDSYKEWLSMGFDGLRIDTASYVKTSWLASFVEDMRRTYPEIYVVGEWNKGGSDVPEAVNFERESSIHLLDFRLQYELSAVFNENRPFTKITDLLAHDSKLTDPYQTMTFLDNHDMPRFLSKAIADGADEKEARQRLEAATYLLLTMRGIPCIYYGTEQYLHNEGKSGWGVGSDPYCRPMMSSFDENGRYFRNMQKLANLRKSNAALSRGRTETLIVADDIYAFCRKSGQQMVVTAVNKGERKSFTVAVEAPSGTYSSTIGPDLTIKDGEAAITLNRHEVMVTSLIIPEHGSLQRPEKQRVSTFLLTGEGLVMRMPTNETRMLPRSYK
ncbi:MAG: alpha-amylase family glycosyl hydrolase [Vulcanimicrobiota bacterium]